MGEGAVPARGDVTRAVVLAATPDSLTVVGGLPLAARAVLVLDRAGFEAVGVIAGVQQAALRAALGQRGLADRVLWLAAPTTPRPWRTANRCSW